MINYPMEFTASVTATGGVATTWSARVPTQTQDLELAIPPEFQGPGGGYSPEDLYLLALANCFVATFKVIAERSKIVVETIGVDATLVVDRGEGGAPWMAAARLRINVSAPAHPHDRVQRVLELTSRQCLILNSVKTQIQFEFRINE